MYLGDILCSGFSISSRWWLKADICWIYSQTEPQLKCFLFYFYQRKNILYFRRIYLSVWNQWLLMSQSFQRSSQAVRCSPLLSSGLTEDSKLSNHSSGFFFFLLINSSYEVTTSTVPVIGWWITHAPRLTFFSWLMQDVAHLSWFVWMEDDAIIALLCYEFKWV